LKKDEKVIKFGWFVENKIGFEKIKLTRHVLNQSIGTLSMTMLWTRQFNILAIQVTMKLKECLKKL